MLTTNDNDLITIHGIMENLNDRQGIRIGLDVCNIYCHGLVVSLCLSAIALCPKTPGT